MGVMMLIAACVVSLQANAVTVFRCSHGVQVHLRGQVLDKSLYASSRSMRRQFLIGGTR